MLDLTWGLLISWFAILGVDQCGECVDTVVSSLQLLFEQVQHTLLDVPPYLEVIIGNETELGGLVSEYSTYQV